MYSEMVEALKTAEADPKSRAIVVTGVGDAFTAGNDLMDFMNTPPAGQDSPVFQLLLTLLDMHTPIIGAVNGVAIGIGTTMLLQFDLVYASPNARFQMPFVNLGLCPEGGSSMMLPMMMGIPKATELLMLGEKFPASQAAEVGIVNAVVDGDVYAHAMEKAKTIASRSPTSIRITKNLIHGPMRERIKAAMAAEGEHFLERLASDEAREAFAAFFEKRAPDFSSFT